MLARFRSRLTFANVVSLIANELASGNDILLERGGATFVANGAVRRCWRRGVRHDNSEEQRRGHSSP